MKVKQLSTLIKEMDKVFSKYIRKKYTKKGYGRCYACRAIKTYEELDASHYIGRQHKSVRWDERNVKVTCQKCNRFLSGNLDEFALALIKEYGQGILEELNKEKYIITKLNELQLQEMIKEYKKVLSMFDERWS